MHGTVRHLQATLRRMGLKWRLGLLNDRLDTAVRHGAAELQLVAAKPSRELDGIKSKRQLHELPGGF
jgi:hypothetical protein